MFVGPVYLLVTLALARDGTDLRGIVGVEGGEQNFIDEGRVGATAALAETGADEETLEFGLSGAVLLELRRVGVEDRLD